MEEVRDTIGIDKVDMSRKLIFVEENHNTDANFILHAITSHCIDKSNIVCFVLFHNTFGHFHNVGMKLGYNLKKLCDSSIKVIEPLKVITRNIHKDNNADSDVNDLKFDIKKKNSDLVKQLAELIKTQCTSLKKDVSQKVYLVIDDLSHLFDIGLSVDDVWLFIRYMRSFINEEPLLTLCIACHVYKDLLDLCQTNLIALSLKYFADLIISVQPLETGYSKNVSGKVTVCWKSQYERLKYKWPEEMIYLFKLHDRQVKLFAPGSSYIM